MSTVAEAIAAAERSPPKRERHADELKRFYNSWQWKRVRFAYLKGCKERRCTYCGSTVADGERIVVDHIRPVRFFWHLRLDPANLTLACDSCNRGKGSTVEGESDETVTAEMEADDGERRIRPSF
jgi:5-methylcytosine-specific restriction endonuclease McrA